MEREYSSVSYRRREAIEGGVNICQILIEGGLQIDGGVHVG